MTDKKSGSKTFLANTRGKTPEQIAEMFVRCFEGRLRPEDGCVEVKRKSYADYKKEHGIPGKPKTDPA